MENKLAFDKGKFEKPKDFYKDKELFKRSLSIDIRFLLTDEEIYILTILGIDESLFLFRNRIMRLGINKIFIGCGSKLKGDLDFLSDGIYIDLNDRSIQYLNLSAYGIIIEPMLLAKNLSDFVLLQYEYFNFVKNDVKNFIKPDFTYDNPNCVNFIKNLFDKIDPDYLNFNNDIIYFWHTRIFEGFFSDGYY